MICGQTDAPDQKYGIHDPFIQLCHRFHDLRGGGCLPGQMCGSVGMFWHFPPISVHRHRPVVLPAYHGIGEIFDIIPHCQYQLIRHQSFIHQIKRQLIRHLPYDHLGFFIAVGYFHYLAGTYTVIFRTVCFDLFHGTWLPAPGMIDQKLGVDSK